MCCTEVDLPLFQLIHLIGSLCGKSMLCQGKRESSAVVFSLFFPSSPDVGHQVTNEALHEVSNSFLSHRTYSVLMQCCNYLYI